MVDVAVIDYGMGNLRSVAKALEHVAPRARVLVTSDAACIADAERVVFPGQGAMPDCMRELDLRGLRDPVLAATRSKPFLGICIGLQMLFDRSEEGSVAGLRVFPGVVKRFPAELMRSSDGSRLKVPHMGWNRVRRVEPSRHEPLLAGLPDEPHVYFVHSFHAVPTEPALVDLVATHGVSITAAVRKDNLFACQFHPEKSQAVGLQILRNFVEAA